MGDDLTAETERQTARYEKPARASRGPWWCSARALQADNRTDMRIIWMILLAMVTAVSAAEEIHITWTPPTENTDGTPLVDLKGYMVLYGQAPDQLYRNDQVPAGRSETFIGGLERGRWYVRILAYNGEGTGRLSPVMDALSEATEPPPPVPKLVTVAPEVYNTGTFDPAAWLVKRNKLYGTIPLGIPCDSAKPAKDGFYRIPVAAVIWTNLRAKTSYPLARCELR